MHTKILCGDNLPILRELSNNSIDAIVTDPPYGLSFMGTRWDYDVPSVELWAECLRVLRPGGHLLAFAGTRTQHRMAVRIEDAGFEIRDMIAWVYGSGFPKSLDISKAIDKAAGAVREVVGIAGRSKIGGGNIAATGLSGGDYLLSTPATDAAKQWDGWGTALKPALEPITLARKPLAERTVAANVLEYGTGGVNVDGCRVGTAADMNARDFDDSRRSAPKFSGKFNNGQIGQYRNGSGIVPDGRFPANFIHDGSDEVVRLFPVTTSGKLNRAKIKAANKIYGIRPKQVTGEYESSTGSAARFFYCAKASRSERDAGLDGVEARQKVFNGQSEESAGIAPGSVEDKFTTRPSKNYHPTVKPVALMRHLCRLVTPLGGIVLDPFAGSGTTGCAAILEGFKFVGIEREAEYAEIARRRIEHWRDVASQDEDVQEKLFAGIR